MAKSQPREDAPDGEYIPMAAETIAGDLRDFLLDRLRNDHSAIPWTHRPAGEQQMLIAQTETACRRAVGLAVDLIAAKGVRAARGAMVKLQAKDGLQLQVNVAASDPMAHALLDNVGSPVLLVLADPEEFLGERAPVKVPPDQPEIFDEAAE